MNITHNVTVAVLWVVLQYLNLTLPKPLKNDKTNMNNTIYNENKIIMILNNDKDVCNDQWRVSIAPSTPFVLMYK